MSRGKSSDPKFYVYEHWRPDTGVIFYVGKGHGDRAYITKGRNSKHSAVMNSLRAAGFALQVKIVTNGMAEKSALEAERKLIANWLSLGADLVNLSSGGEGISGFRISEETKRKLSEANKGKPAAFKGKKHKPATIAILSKKAKERGPQLQLQTSQALAKVVAFHTGRKRSAETCARVSESLKGKPNWAKGKRSKLRGRKLSEEVKSRMRLAALKKWERQKASGWVNPRIGATCSENARIKMKVSARKRTDHVRMTDGRFG